MISGVSSSIVAFHAAAGAHGRPAGAPEPVRAPDPSNLTEEEQQQVEALKERDQEVRAHEQAHARAGGPYASAPSYEFERGPDGKMYAVSGEVQIDTAPIDGDAAATIAKMEVVIRAALAPQEPSSQDTRVAAEARAAKAEAQAELREEKQEEAREVSGDENSADGRAHTRAAQAYESAEGLVFEAIEAALNIAA
ncbi:MAG: hypothetical protein GKS02_03250 [Alphaproteobacteria bacterium]|nr:hypothetical protein [Alphaproteobacteria bacterium]